VRRTGVALPAQLSCHSLPVTRYMLRGCYRPSSAAKGRCRLEVSGVCVCVREREREWVWVVLECVCVGVGFVCVSGCVCIEVCVCVCVCVCACKCICLSYIFRLGRCIYYDLNIWIHVYAHQYWQVFTKPRVVCVVHLLVEFVGLFVCVSDLQCVT